MAGEAGEARRAVCTQMHASLRPHACVPPSHIRIPVCGGQVVEPLDAAVDMPEGLSFDVWDRLVECRNAKIASEDDLKAATAQLAEMHTFLHTLEAQDAQLQRKDEEFSEELQARRKAELVASWNLELPFKLKQGQLEVRPFRVLVWGFRRRAGR